jgi:hypothetical protein
VSPPRGPVVSRPPIRPFATGHVVQAVSVQVLASGMKDVWQVVHRFDRRPTGCELSPAVLAEKVGMTRRTVEDYVAQLVALGLLVRLEAGGLAATVPDDCVPSSTRPGWREVKSLADRLEHIVRIGATGPHEPDPDRGNPTAWVGANIRPGSGETGPSAPDPDRRVPAQTSPKSTRPGSGQMEQLEQLENYLQLESAHAPNDKVGVPDMYLTLEEQQQRRDRVARKAKGGTA